MATNYLPSSGWYSTSNSYIFYRFKIDDSVSNGARSVKVTLQAYKSSSSTASTTTKGTFYMTINGTAYNLSIAQNTNFYADGTVRDYGSASPTIAIGTSTLTVKGYFDVSRFSSSEQGGSITLTASSFTNTISHWAWGFKNGEGNNGNKNAYILGETTFTKQAGNTFVLNTSNATTIPNGFYVEQNFVTPSISGSWVEYAFGTTVTQKSSAMSFEYDYQPYTYNITYDLDGGTNNANNPATYNVLYGVSLQAPTKDYHTFKGWRIQTEAKNMSFVSPSNTNYKWERIISNIQPNVEYDISLRGKLNSGTAAGFKILMFDFTLNVALTETPILSFDNDININLKCPETANASNDIAIIIYAGVNGSTANNSVTYSNVKVDYYSPLPIYDIDFSNTNFVKNAAINSSTGEYIESTNYNYTATPDLIPIQGGLTLYSNMTVCGIYTYDANGNFIKRESSYTKIHPISSNAKYMRVEIALNTNTYEEYAANFKLDNGIGINKCLDATFSSASDLYAKLTARMTGNVTAKAIWEPWEHEVIFDYNGGYGEIPNNFIASSEDEIYLSDIQPKSLERIFIYWNTKSDGSGVSYKSGELYNNYINGGSVTLYAMYYNPDIYLNSDNSIECMQFIEESNCKFPRFEKGGIIIAKEFIEHDGKIMIQDGILYASSFIEKDILPGLALL